MKKFLKKIIFFLIILSIINIVLYVFLTKEVVFGKYVFNEKNFEDYDVFLLSDSHGEALKNLTNEFGICNFSYVGDNYQDMYYKLSFLLPHLDEKDLVLITVNNHTLSTYRDVSANTKRNLIYVNSIESLYDENLQNEYLISNLFKRIPIFQTNYGRFYFDYMRNKSKGNIFVNEKFNKIPIEEREKLVHNRFQQQFVGYEVSDKGSFFLKKIIKLSDNNKFKLIGIKYPVTSLYHETIGEFDMKAQELLLLNDVEVVDFQDKMSFPDSLFKDQDHLNKEGAMVLLKKLNSILVNN